MKTLRYGFLMTALVVMLFAGMSLSPAQSHAGSNPAVIIDTNVGRIILLLYPQEAPNTVKNFLKYVDAGFYDGTVFHRVTREEDFKSKSHGQRVQKPYSIIQGGGLTPDLQTKRPLFPPIKNEAAKGLQNMKGTIAMARGGDPNSATSQFFINVTDNPDLNYSMTQKQQRFETREGRYETVDGYCAFGKVIRGMDVVEKINKVKRQKKGRHENVPVQPIVIKRMYRPQ